MKILATINLVGGILNMAIGMAKGTEWTGWFCASLGWLVVLIREDR